MSAQDERKRMEAARDFLRANSECYEDGQKEICRLYFSRFRKFIEAGFTEQQAFEFVKQRGLE